MHLTSLLQTILYKAYFRVSRNSIMTTSKKMQEVLDDLKKNPYYDKYSQKITQLQKEDPSTFKQRVEEKSNVKKIKPPPPERDYSKLLQPKQKIAEPVQIKKESLEKIMKIDLIKDKDAEEIKSIWQQYHLQKDYTLAAVVPASDFDKMIENSKKYSTFLFPLPRSQGYEFIMCQFSHNTIHFTPLLFYQVHKENAPECLTLTHYDEFKDSKKIVLMRGEYDSNVINAKEAQCLANQVQLYYIQAEPEKLELMQTFTEKPDEFKPTDLIKQLENLSII